MVCGYENMLYMYDNRLFWNPPPHSATLKHPKFSNWREANLDDDGDES